MDLPKTSNSSKEITPSEKELLRLTNTDPFEGFGKISIAGV